MRLIVFATVAACVFLAGDMVMIPLVMRPLFKAALGDGMLDQLRLGPAALFYIIHLGGLTYFAGRTALTDGAAGAARDGLIYGLATYACYEMTSWTIMRDWTHNLVVVDLAWGAALSSLAALAGGAVAKRWR